jgi:hypothetical protein
VSVRSVRETRTLKYVASNSYGVAFLLAASRDVIARDHNIMWQNTKIEEIHKDTHRTRTCRTVNTYGTFDRLGDIFVVFANIKILADFIGIDRVLPRKVRQHHRIVV